MKNSCITSLTFSLALLCTTSSIHSHKSELSSLDAAILSSYFAKCKERISHAPEYARSFAKTATCGHCSGNDIGTTVDRENEIVILTTFIHGAREEFEKPSENLNELEKETMKGSILLAREAQQHDPAASVLRSNLTKCHKPVYYIDGTGRLQCTTFVSQKELIEYRDQLAQESDENKDRLANKEEPAEDELPQEIVESLQEQVAEPRD